MVDEAYVTLAEVREMLEKEKAARPALTNEQQYAFQHAALFTRIDAKAARDLVAELRELTIADGKELTEVNAVKLADLTPTHPDDVRAVFAKERFTLTTEDVDRILQIVGKYL